VPSFALMTEGKNRADDTWAVMGVGGSLVSPGGVLSGDDDALLL